AVEDSAVAAYLLNPARQSYPLEQLCLETLGENPPDLAGAAALGRAELGARLAARARAVWRYWAYAAGQLDALGLRSVHAEIERPDQDRLLDGRRRPDRARPWPRAAGQDPRVPDALEAQVDLRRHAARPHRPPDRPDPHELQPARRRDGAPEQRVA